MNNTLSANFVSGQQKIAPHHQQRLACIYLRQSSPGQVRENKEGLVNQYQLVERARQLGWLEPNICIIDADLGLSAKSSERRLGFQELVSMTSLGQVGIIFGYEVSRLARNNADWYHLLDIAGHRNTLVGDQDGVYDPNHINDRLLLGLKGAISEFELHSIRLRMDAGRLSKLKRGEYRLPLPTGYVRLKGDVVVKDPDEQVRLVVQLVFDKFQELGSVSKVTRYLRKNNILLPRRQNAGVQQGEVLWKTPAHSAIHAMLKNPAYAGTFTFARKNKSPDQWHVHHNLYPAYLSWEQFLAHQETLRQNFTHFDQHRQGAQGPAREGAALLQGLVWCGCCGGRLHVRYTKTAQYVCSHLPFSAEKGSCLHTVAHKVDEAVCHAFFQAIQPAQLDALQAWLDHQQQEQATLDQQWRQKLERSRYQAALAERRYRAVDPDNRLVAATLEQQWEQQLQACHLVQTDYDAFSRQCQSPPLLTPELRSQFEHIGDTLPALWPKLPNEQKKLLLRSLIAQVILAPKPQEIGKASLEVKLVWRSGHFSLLALDRHNHPFWHQLPSYPAMLERIHALWQQGCSDKQIAQQLHDEGFPAYYQNAKLSWYNIRSLRLSQGWSVRPKASQTPPLINGCYIPRGLAIACHTDKDWILRRIYDRLIDPTLVSRHPQQRTHLIRAFPELIDKLTLLAAQSIRKPRKPV
jgi:DNA invertase Pin-like site-specific DNA recombinase